MSDSISGLKNLAMRGIITTGGLTVRDVDGGEKPFLYSSQNNGPGYVDIKGRVGWDEVFEPMVHLLAYTLIDEGVTDIELIVGMMTGGSMPGFRLKQMLQQLLGRRVAYIYQRGARKVGGHGELDTGDRENQHIQDGCKTLVVEELVNFAVTTCNGAQYERENKGRVVEHAGAILSYENPVAIQRLSDHNLHLHYPISLTDLLDYGLEQGLLEQNSVQQYRSFLADPKKWNEDRGYTFYGAN